ILSKEGGAAGGGALLAQQAADQRGLADAVPAQEGVDVAFPHGEGDAVQGGAAAAAEGTAVRGGCAAVADVHLVEGEQGVHGSPSPAEPASSVQVAVSCSAASS